jgi:hypothetical protein
MWEQKRGGFIHPFFLLLCVTFCIFVRCVYIHKKKKKKYVLHYNTIRYDFI